MSVVEIKYLGELLFLKILYLAVIINAVIHKVKEINEVDIKSIEKDENSGDDEKFIGIINIEINVNIR